VYWLGAGIGALHSHLQGVHKSSCLLKGRAAADDQSICHPPHTHTHARAQDEWTATGCGGQKFEDVDLREEWADYDEKAAESVSIMSVESKFELYKGK